MSTLRITPGGLFLGDQPFYLASGSTHYFRILPGDWEKRLALMKDFGLTAVQTYVPWNLHEPREGVFDFSGMLDLAAFLHAADRCGLKVLLRPSPYICSEWDFGGLPWWLLKKEPIALRCMDPKYTAAVKAYYQRVCREFIPYLSTRGGPIIAVTVENEYGSYGNDRDYLVFLMDALKAEGVDVPFYTTDGYGAFWLENGTIPGIWAGANYRIESATAIAALREFQRDKPPYVGEYWSGRSSHWGEEFSPREVAPVAAGYREALEHGGLVNFYMFSGGTNWGFMNGANIGGTFQPGGEVMYRPLVTSYDVDALIAEDGRPTKKYYACRRELDRFLGKPERPDDPPPYRTQAVSHVKLTHSAPLFGQLDALSKPVRAAAPMTMEQLDEGYGFVLYETTLRGGHQEAHPLHIDGLHDRALVFVNGVHVGTYQRDMPPPDLRIGAPEKDIRLSILVENLGRVNFGPHLKDAKGILGGVRWGHVFLFGWEMRALPLSDLSSLTFREGGKADEWPAFYRGTFQAEGGVDTHVHMTGWGKGCVWINGIHLGRYWSIGPQETLYVPGGLLRDGENEMVVFELHHPGKHGEVALIDHAILDGYARLDVL